MRDASASAPTSSRSSPGRTRASGDARRHPARAASAAAASRRTSTPPRCSRSRSRASTSTRTSSTTPYPFGKYDQVFVPEFNAGAMENVGAITHNERMVFRDPPTENQRREPRRGRAPRDGAHVVRRPRDDEWWNDLWLNESFATYMAYLSHDRARRASRAAGRRSTPA